MEETPGGPLSKSETPLKRLLARRCRQAVRQQAMVLRKGNPGAVHDLRVATRRLQEILDFLEPVLPPRPRRRLSRRARRIRRTLGRIRNVDVMRDLVRSLARRCPPAQRKSLEPLAERLAAEARALRGDRRGRGLEVPGLRERVRRLGSHLHPLDGFSFPVRAREILVARVAALSEQMPGARSGRSAALHALRIAVKRHRYTLEILEESGMSQTRPAIAAARTLQTRLGKIHDLDILAALIRRRAGKDASRRVLARVSRERRERVAEALETLERFDPAEAIAIVEAAAAAMEAA